jgi:hypothetical protein
MQNFGGHSYSSKMETFLKYVYKMKKRAPKQQKGFFFIIRRSILNSFKLSINLLSTFMRGDIGFWCVFAIFVKLAGILIPVFVRLIYPYLIIFLLLPYMYNIVFIGHSSVAY